MAKARKRLFLALGVLLLALIGLNVLIHYAARSSYRRQMLLRLEHMPPGADCVFLGNSLAEAGCNPAAFRSAWPDPKMAPQPVNLALGATSPVEHYLILHQAFRHPLHLKYLVYAFFDDQLNAAAHGDWSDLVGNRAFSYYFPDEAAPFYAPGSRLKRWELRLIGHIPMLAERSSLWGKIDQLRRRFEDLGLPPRPVNRFGRVGDFAALEPKDAAAFNRRCGTLVATHAGLSAAVEKIIELGRDHGARVILVEMPMPTRHRQRFYSSAAWAELRRHLQALATQHGATYLHASDWVKDDLCFEDATHLNEMGAAVFSRQLAATLAALPTQTLATGPRIGAVKPVSLQIRAQDAARGSAQP